MELHRFHAEQLGSEKFRRIRERLGKPPITEPEATYDIIICINAFYELRNSRVFFEGIPAPITYNMVRNFYNNERLGVPFKLFKDIVGRLDVYDLDKDYERRKNVNQQRNK